MLTKEPLADTVEVVGALNAQTLVFRDAAGELHTLGKEFQADYVADEIVCFTGAAAHAVVQNVDLANQFIFELARQLDSSESYLFGDLTTSDKISLPENIRVFTPVTGSGSLIRLNYATANDLRAFGLENIFITKGVLTVKSLIGEGGGVSGAQLLPGPHRYEQVTFPVAAEESVVILKTEGDTVSPGDALARRVASRLIGDQLARNDDRVRLLRRQDVAALADLERKVIAAGGQARLDSVRYANDSDFYRRGYLGGTALEASKARWEKSRLGEARLYSFRALAAEKSAVEIRRLITENDRLREKQVVAERDRELRSPAAGILLDVRQVDRNGHKQLTFIVRRP
jgi:hypothetical protein